MGGPLLRKGAYFCTKMDTLSYKRGSNTHVPAGRGSCLLREQTCLSGWAFRSPALSGQLPTQFTCQTRPWLAAF